ncbi:MAG: NAD(+) synthase [Planctomycetota bacterium]
MKVALCQVETRVGAFAENAERIAAFAHEARRRGAALAVFPELAVAGYPPRDLLLRPDFVREAARRTAEIAARCPEDMKVLVGTVELGARKLRNVAALLEGGAVRASRAKSLLPSYDVFFEERWFEPAPSIEPLGELGVLLCEDLWDERYEKKPARTLVAAGASVLVALNASPYRKGVLDERLRRARRTRAPLVYVNAVGAEDELVFDGGSFALDARGRLLAQLPRFEEALAVVDMATEGDGGISSAERPEDLLDALVLGVRRFAERNGCREAVLGLSGGVDSALVLSIAARALGGRNVRALAIPSRFNDPRSESEARALARALGARFETVSLEPLLRAAEGALDLSGPTTFENAQARLRMLVLMADVNRRGGLLLNTSNKTELALGYGTLFGDLAGDLAPIGDLTKPEVYALARLCPETPRFILERAPSAELAPGQVDPFDYDRVSPLVDALLRGESPEDLVRRGAERAEVEELARRVKGAEHKRRLAPLVLKVSESAIGSGRLVPVTRGSSPSPLPRPDNCCTVLDEERDAWPPGEVALGPSPRRSSSP